MKRAIVSVTNDLATDQRVDRVCSEMANLGFDVLLVGRKRPSSPPLPHRVYKLQRLQLFFTRGFLFYAEYNIRLFFFLAFRKAGLLVANDLDTLLPNFLIHKIKRIPIIYDSHELFTEMPEVIHRPFVKRFWVRLERWIFPKLTDVFTVSDSIAEIYRTNYKIDVKVVRNVPVTRNINKVKSRQELGLPDEKRILILQGSGINIQRGAEEMIEAMQRLKGCLLLVIGDGDVIPQLKKLVEDTGVESKVWFFPRLPVDELIHYTRNADLGLTLDKDTNLNYKYSLPNKLFDYIHAGIPVLASPLTEVKKIVENYGIGLVIENHNPDHIALKINEAFKDPKQTDRWKENLKFAARELCWEKDKEVLTEVYSKYA